MAGKEEKAPTSSSSTPKNISSEQFSSPEVCWRKEADSNLKRLHSLLFGADAALEKGDFASARLLSIGLLGFLDSQCHSDVDEAFIRPICREALSKLDLARRSLIPPSDRQAFEQAGREPTAVFSKKSDIDIEKIKQSKHFQALLSQSKGTEPNNLLYQGYQRDKLKKSGCNAKLTSTYRNVSKENDNTFEAVDDEERGRENSYGAKRLHLEITSPSNRNVKSPSCNEESENDASGSGFVTARTKLEMDAWQRRGLAGSPSASVSPQSDHLGRGYGVRSYGFPRRGIRGNFIPPVKSNGNSTGNMTSRSAGKGEDALDDSTKRCLELLCGPDGELPEKLRNLEPRLIEHISNEIMDRDPNVRWDDIGKLLDTA